MKFTFEGPSVKFYWHVPMFIHVHVVCGGWCPATEELSCLNRDRPTEPKIIAVGAFTEQRAEHEVTHGTGYV